MLVKDLRDALQGGVVENVSFSPLNGALQIRVMFDDKLDNEVEFQIGGNVQIFEGCET